MATYTTNYNLEKPDSTDDFKDFRSNYNSNMDIIDQNLGGGGGSSVSWQQLQVTGDKIATIRVSGINTDVFTPNSQTFSMAVSRININSGETYPTIFGKIKKWFADLKAVAFSGSYNDLSNKPTIPTATSDLNNDSDFVSDASYVHTDNNFTNADVTKLSGIQSGAEVNVQSDWSQADSSADDYIKNKPTIPTVNDGTLTIQQNGTTVGTFTANQSGNTTVNLSGGGGSAHTIVNESGTSLADEPNLQFTDGLKATDDSVNSKTVVGVNTTFTEAQTRANIASGDTFATILGKIKKFFADLKAVAFSGSYNDLSDKPTIPSAQVNSDWNANSGVAQILNKPSLATVATSGSYNDLSNKPTIPDISTKVSKSGDTMTGQLKTSFNSSVAMGSYSASSHTIPDLCNELRYSSGCCGSAEIRTAYSGSPSSVGTGWYNFLWIPHRSGGKNGNADGDNCNYGRLILRGMTVGGEFEIRFNSGSIAYCRELISSANIGSQSVNYATSATQDSDGNAINSTYLKKTGGDMSGMLGEYNENNVAINFRNNSDYYTTISYQTAGNEACVFATKNAHTSWIFVNGEDSVNNHAKNRWQSLTPALQIKNGCVAIGKLIPSGTTPSYALEISGVELITASADTPLRIQTTTTGKCYMAFYNKTNLLGFYAVGTDKLPYFEPQGSSDRRIALLDEIQLGHEMGNTEYVSNDTHYLKLCTITLGQYYEYISLLVTSSFWGNQHGSADMINIQASRGSSASETPYTIQRINLAGNGGNAGQDGGREFYYYSSGNTLIIYVYVTGGNSYGSWNVSELRLKNATIEYNFQTNVTLPSGTTSNYIRLAGGVAYAYKADDADGDEDGMRIKTNYGSSLFYDGTRLYLRARYGNDLSSVTINTSSKRYKTNIEDLPEEEAKKILDVRTVNFDFKEKRWGRDRYTYDQKGVIAEEVEEIIPTAVRVTEIDGEVVPDAVDYSEFVPYLIKMVQMQQKEIDELKAIIKGGK